MVQVMEMKRRKGALVSKHRYLRRAAVRDTAISMAVALPVYLWRRQENDPSAGTTAMFAGAVAGILCVGLLR
jgi:hypothetical protein